MKVSVNRILYHWYTKKTKNNKSWEFQVSWLFHPYLVFNIFEFDCSQYPSLNINIFNLLRVVMYNSTRQDHAGFYLNINILGLDVDLNHYDIRHWNYDEDRWETPEEVEEENRKYLESLKNDTQ